MKQPYHTTGVPRHNLTNGEYKPPLGGYATPQPNRVRGSAPRGYGPATRQNFTFGASLAASLVTSKYSLAFAPVTLAVSTAGNLRMNAL